MSERDSESRATTSGMRVTLNTDDGSWTGSVGDTSSAGASVAFRSEEAPVLPLGTRLQLTFSGGPLPDPVSVAAVLRARSEGDFRRYGFSFEEARRFGGRAPAAWGAFNRREHIRVAPDRPVPVRVEVIEGPAAGRAYSGQLADLSKGGLAAILDADAEETLDSVLHVRCTLRPAGAEADDTYTCTIRNRQLADGSVRYGLAFLADDEAEIPVPIYEPLWDCGACGTGRLLSNTHAHCPTCGARPPHDRTYFPPWDEVVTAADHPFCGTDRTCACGATWSGLAHCCGSCGAPL